MVKGNIFNIQSYCIHDGPGVRTTVFLKGCPLRCQWCQNPESQEHKKQLMFYQNCCQKCGRCALVCPEHAVSWTAGALPITNRTKCTGCGVCEKFCPAHAREIAGEWKSVDEVLQIVLLDKVFFDGSSGGITVSGGEPLSQPEFCAELLMRSREAKLRTAIETSCFAGREAVKMVFPHVELAMCDIKHMDSEQHKKLTGVANELILDNILYIHKTYPIPLIIRTPVIPGANDSEQNILNTAQFIVDRLGENVEFQLLPYNKLGESKHQNLERTEEVLRLEQSPKARLEHLVSVAKSVGLQHVEIGG